MITPSQMLEITNGNVHAADFCASFLARVHFIDDIVDKDIVPSDEKFVRSEQDFLEQFMLNPWARANQMALWPLMVVGFNAWLDANEWEKTRNKRLQADAAVLKGVYHEVFWFTAYLCGGREHMRKMTRKYRDFDHEERK